MNYKDTSGYEIIYPQNISNIVLVSDHLQGDFSLADNSVIDDAFNYINRKLILIQYNKAGINVTVKSAGGSPLEGVPIPNITLNYDGTGEVVTDSNGTAFGYCDAGSINIAPVSCADVTYTSQQIEVLAGEMYNVEITGTVINFVKYVSSGSLMFSNNVQSIDVTCVGGGGGGASAGGGDGNGGDVSLVSGNGGGGGYCVSQDSYPFETMNSYSFVVGSGGSGGLRASFVTSGDYRVADSGRNGGNSSFSTLAADGGTGGGGGRYCYYNFYGNASIGSRGNGNGNGGLGRILDGGSSTNTGYSGNNGITGTQSGYSSFSETILYGGGGAGGGINATSSNTIAGASGGGYGGSSPSIVSYPGIYPSDGGNGTDGFGGGGAGGSINCRTSTSPDIYTSSGGRGGSGCIAIRMHLKVTA